MNAREPAPDTRQLGQQSVPGAGATVFTCGLCGFRFTHGGRACSPCSLRASCDLVQCPHCGFQFPRTSRAVDWARRLFERRRRS